MHTLWTPRNAQRTQRLNSSAIRELVRLTARSDMISPAGGLLAPEVFPLGEFQMACQRIMVEHGRHAMQYGTTEGYRPLREMIAWHTTRYGLAVDPENSSTSQGKESFVWLGTVPSLCR